MYGAGLDEDNIVRQVGVVPKPLQKPHPPIFQPFASSERTIRWCAREGITAILPPMYPEMQNRLYEVYQEEAAAAGRTLKPGEGLGVLRDVLITDTDDEAMEIWARTAAFCGAAWFAPFGFADALRPPGRDRGFSPQEMMDRGLLFAGTVDTVKRQVQNMLDITPVSWVFMWQYNGLAEPRADSADDRGFLGEGTAGVRRVGGRGVGLSHSIRHELRAEEADVDAVLLECLARGSTSRCQWR